MRLLTLTLILALCAGGAASADSFMVDPIHGNPAGDGSKENPWRTFQEVVEAGLIESQTWNTFPWYNATGLVTLNEGAPIKAGDEIVLMSGYHGEIVIQAYLNTDYITVRAAEGHKPCFGNILVRSCKNWRFQGISVSPSYAPEYTATRLFFIENHNWRGPSSYIILENSEFFSEADASGWSQQDWLDKSATALQVSGDYCEIRNNTFTNINFGISVTGDYCTVTHNSVVNFSGDAMRGLGDHGVFEGNFVANGFDVNANHDDGFQSWATNEETGEVLDVTLRGNVFYYNWYHPNLELISSFQGIGLFDGFFTDWVVENNVVVADHWHGISFYGARNCRIQNNTVIDTKDGSPGPSWIMVTTHKDGTGGYGNIVRNNLANSYSINENAGVDIMETNLTLSSDDYETIFVDPYHFNFHLRPGCAAIDAGANSDLPATDIEGNPRLYGASVDLGAYEFHPLPSQVNSAYFLLLY